jgi:hypothetical protein
MAFLFFSVERRIYLAGKEFAGKDKVVTKMTRDGLTEENLADGFIIPRMVLQQVRWCIAFPKRLN